MLVNGYEGILSIGGTGAAAVDLVVQQTKDELDRAGALERGEVPVIPTTDLSVPLQKSKPLPKGSKTHTGELDTRNIDKRQTRWEDEWAWSHIQGAEGWWQMLMQGVWVDGSRVLQNQAVVIDVRCHTTSSVQ